MYVIYVGKVRFVDPELFIKTNMKRKIEVEVESFSKYDLDGPVSSVVEFFNSILQKHGSDTTLDFYGDEFYIYTEREETDEEYQARIDKEKFWTDNREKADREKYEELKKKFG
jgi:hypothetical protein